MIIREILSDIDTLL